MKEDEKRFLIDIYKRCRNSHTDTDGLTPRDIINESEFYMNHKRAWRILDKWSTKNWYSYGVTLDLGWLEPEGIKKAIELDK